MKESVTAIFDIGKTNKKIILFDQDLKVVLEKEQQFSEIKDDDGFECDDIEQIEKWIRESISWIIKSGKYDLDTVNFTTYGASLVYLDENGKRLTPVYNYLKPMNERIPESLYKRYGGRDEFCRRTASPALGMLNSGLQPLWLKAEKPDIYNKVKSILHLPQYIAYTLTGKICSEHTSIGCHTALWDFDNMVYHHWTDDYNIFLPEPIPVNTVEMTEIDGKKIKVGIGIHDSSASLAPYFSLDKGKFLLLSTGTWCINMNPFNQEKLTVEQLDNDCLCYMSINRQPVKSSRLFLGHLHDEGIKLIADHFNKPGDYYKKIKADKKMSAAMKLRFSHKKIFFESDSREMRKYVDLYEFVSYEEAYHQFMNELCDLTLGSIRLVLPEDDDIRNLYITGGFSKNELFLNLICEAFPEKLVFTSEIANASALGAALVVSGKTPVLNLGMTECRR